MQSGSTSVDPPALVVAERPDRLPPVPIVIGAIIAAEILWLIVLLALGARYLL